MYVGCFEAGPLPGDLALYLIDDLTGHFETGQFTAQLFRYGVDASDSKFLFAGITSKQYHGRHTAMENAAYGNGETHELEPCPEQ